jgi:hypothetical protein
MNADELIDKNNIRSLISRLNCEYHVFNQDYLYDLLPFKTRDVFCGGDYFDD